VPPIGLRGHLVRSRSAARLSWTVVAGLLGSLLLAACGGNSGPAAVPCPAGTLAVAAAENFWGSIAAQVGGNRACVTSIIVNPDTDPHAYEAKPVDARLIASAKYVIFNGAGYDPWAPKLLDANPVPGRSVLNIGDLLGKKQGDNPHLWYSPAYVDLVVDKIAADLAAADPQDAAYFDQQKAQYRTVGLKGYHDTVNTIKQKYEGTPVGASESIFAYLAPALGLNLITPPEYLKAISEGTDPSAADKATIQDQIASRSIKVFVYNSQNSTPEVKALVAQAKARGIPVSEVTETLAPANVTFQDWQTNQLSKLLAALGG
jgi:zinc/manganese transport system substrate-binding protein